MRITEKQTRYQRRDEMITTKDRDYLKELHNTARTYNTQLWAIPAVFFGLMGLVIGNLEFENFWGHQNLTLLAFGALTSFLLLLQFNKTSIVSILIQEEINKFEKQEKYLKDRMPMYSIPDINLRMELAQKNNKNIKFYCWEKCLAGATTTKWFKFTMIITGMICAIWAYIILSLYALNNRF